jgi:hypothetical protein
MKIRKKIYKSEQDSHTITGVTLPLSFDSWNKKTGLWPTLINLRNENEVSRSDKEPQSTKIIFIYSSKRLKDYYVLGG